MVNTGSGISLLKADIILVDKRELSGAENGTFTGINQSVLSILGTYHRMVILI